MDKDIRESIALARFQIISPILAEPKRAQNDYFREQAGKEHVFARYGTRRISVSTMKAWLKVYRLKGFEGLKPKTRTDNSRPRRLDDEKHGKWLFSMICLGNNTNMCYKPIK